MVVSVVAYYEATFVVLAMSFYLSKNPKANRRRLRWLGNELLLAGFQSCCCGTMAVEKKSTPPK